MKLKTKKVIFGVGSDITKLIGNTPIVKINTLNNNYNIIKNVTIYAKLEGFNPTGSIKDRIALEMINSSEKKGILTKNKTIIEPSSGNTGIALAMIGKLKGYDVQIVMSKNVSKERRKIIKSYGAKLTLTDAMLGTDGAILKTKELIKKHPEKYVFLNQFENKANYMAHYKTTAKEIYKQTKGKIDYVVASIGTSGTLMGISKYLKKKNPNIKIISAHPEQNHKIQGLKNMSEAIVPKIYNPKLIDETIEVKTKDAIETAKKIIQKEGIFVGMSSGAALYAALQIAKKIDKGNIVAIFPDRGEKYLSTKLF